MFSLKIFAILLLAAFTNCTVDILLESDYYKLLGIERNADNREIRKSFKKLALILHPDKNNDDPKAHEKFLKINRAYEILKDEQTRNIYDMHGEKGLEKDNSARGSYSHFQSWNYYYESFGIYDNDEEIVTLNRADFDLSVKNTTFIWFVNFYSGRCSHCHHLAPEWRKLAKELNSIIRIGAVNCEEDRPLCQSEGIRSYPSLILYPNVVRFQGERNLDSLIDFVLRNLKINRNIFDDANFADSLKNLIETIGSQSRFVAIACVDKHDCLFEDTRKLLTYKLKNFATLIEIECSESKKKSCQHLQITESSIVLFPNITDSVSNQIVISSSDAAIDASELFRKIINKLPKINSASNKDLNLLSKCLIQQTGSPSCDQIGRWIIVFTKTASSEFDVELKSLVVFMPEASVMKVACDEENSMAICGQFSINKYPTVMLVKDSISFERYIGRLNAIDVMNFAKDSFQASLQTLNEEQFVRRVAKRSDPWVIEFYAPWCPMCKVALSKLRKASQNPLSVQFGVIDCTIYPALCRQYNIHSYPTLLFYNQTHPHQFYGNYEEEAIVEFILNILDSKVIDLTPEKFKTLVEKRSKPEIWAVDFFSPYCKPCNQLAPVWRKLANMIEDEPNIRLAQVNCVLHNAFCREMQVQSYPTLRLYPSLSDKRHRHTFYKFNDHHRDVYMIQAWLYDYLPTSIEEIDSNGQFQRILSSNSPHLIDFYYPRVFSSRKFTPDFIRLSKNFTEVKFVRLNCQRLYTICDEAMVQYFPSIRFYSGTSGPKQASHGFDIQLSSPIQMYNSIRSFMSKPLTKDEL